MSINSKAYLGFLRGKGRTFRSKWILVLFERTKKIRSFQVHFDLFGSSAFLFAFKIASLLFGGWAVEPPSATCSFTPVCCGDCWSKHPIRNSGVLIGANLHWILELARGQHCAQSGQTHPGYYVMWQICECLGVMGRQRVCIFQIF